MADNVNIIVQDTINDIVVNAAVVVETIDINVQAAVDVVDIVANPNNYVVNINRIIGEQVQSDWDQTDNQAPDYIKNKPTIPTATSDLTNDGSDGVNPFITAADIPPVTGFVPYTGATANVDLGEYELKAGQVEFDQTPTGTAAVATTRWNDSIGTTETTLKGGSVVLKNGVDLVARVVNKVTPNTTLTKAAYQAVRISGAQGQRLAVAYAQANNDNNSADTIGIVCETIATNQEGFILTVGQLEEINTTGSLQGETWADGDVLYLSPTTAGKLTNIKPTGATGHIVVMGYVEYAHAVHGKIYVKIMNGWELDELHNVFINSPANNEGLFYDSADSLWKNETIASALGYTPVTDARTISTTAPLSGGGDLTANRTLSISQATTSTDGYLSSTNWNTFNNKFTLPALTSGSVLFSNGTTIAQDNANLFWDDTNNRLGIGTATPASSLQVVGGDITIDNNKGYLAKVTSGSTLSLLKFDTSNNCLIGSNFQGGATNIYATTNTLFYSYPSSVLTERMRIVGSTGNVLIGTTTDAGFRLDVNGTARVQGNSFQVTDGGTNRISITSNQISCLAGVSIANLNVVAGAISMPNSTLGIGTTITGGTTSTLVIGSGNATNASGTITIGQSSRGFAPTSGTATFSFLTWDGTINQTGGANGITRGLYINPTLTAAADFRAIETTVGNVMLNTTSGNTLIGTSTNAGFKLDVNGTARVSGVLTVGGNIVPSAGSTYNVGSAGVPFSSAYVKNVVYTNQLASYDTHLSFANSGFTFARITNTTGNFIIQNGGTYTDIASARLTVNSTTQGFLPPRMTNAQRLAIASPAVGLMVYCTDAVEGLYVNKSTGWTFVI